MGTKVAIFEDNKLLRDGFEAICNGTPGLSCCGAYADSNSLIHKIERSNPDVVLMDIEMPGIDGITATRIITARWPDIKILIQTVFEDDDKIFNAICAGASGYILKSTPPAKMVEAIYEVQNGGSPMTPNIANRVLRLFQQFAPAVSTDNENYILSSREKEVLALMVEGNSFHNIASTLFLSYETIRTHVKRIYKKLHVASASEAVAKAIRQRLV
ncbi:MAG: response regulator transcription factor [Chitinophagaceae bacterium]|nr:response regulator transcription factor [Chitinophagaceae bacterium]